MSAKLNIALIGAGLIGRPHLQRLDTSPDCACAADAARTLAVVKAISEAARRGRLVTIDHQARAQAA
ncbi:hypothetical protein [Bosea sp. 685]|uniref:hypothetical protein n=1 Tax=Bosea sp. 685 TaxID=3080057 RepID=UPI0028931CFF|nr:hypothetical protein [Bosea sp. 685]WNJ88244.1 hypothetical protein RMR04_17665 [Bosea sp. 685]